MPPGQFPICHATLLDSTCTPGTVNFAGLAIMSTQLPLLFKQLSSMNEQTTIVITLTFLRGFCGVVAILPMSCWRLAGMGLVSLIVINVPNEMEGPDVCESQVCIEYNL